MFYSVGCRICGKELELSLPLSEHGNWPICCQQQTSQIIRPQQIMPDIQPYQTIAADKETGKPMNITSRRAHKEFLRRNRLIEIGNEIPKATRAEYDSGPREKLREDIRGSIRQVLGR